jgi:hypothetical protein
VTEQPRHADRPVNRLAAAVRIVRDATLIAVALSVVGLAVNAVRSSGIPWVAEKEYEILVPCPEPVGEAEELAASDPRVLSDKSLRIDARSPEEYAEWHLPSAMNLPFDWLGPPPDEEVRIVAKKVATTRTQRVVVYGDGDDPDSGREWARLLSGARLKNIFYVRGGAPALGGTRPKEAP